MFIFLPAGSNPASVSQSSSEIAAQSARILVAAAPGTISHATIAATVRGLDPDLVVDVARLADNLEQWRAPSIVVSSLSASLALLALVLACTGVFGTVAYGVSRRVREIGIRVALGAAHEDVLRLIVRQGMRPVLVGMLIGMAAAAAASTVLVNMLFGLSPHDPLSFVLVPVVLFAIALAACYVPARRALRVEPVTALRAE